VKEKGLKMDIQRISAFAYNNEGGNPAGVAFYEKMPTKEEMLRIAKEVGYSESAFLVKQDENFRIKYFSPEEEVAFCGHATIASAAALAQKYGEGKYNLIINDGEVNVEVQNIDGNYFATLSSVNTYSQDVDTQYVQRVVDEFNFNIEDLNEDFPVKIAFAGARHLIFVVKDKQKLVDMEYNFDAIKELMKEKELTTISILFSENETLIHSRNAFAFGGVYEDPATGAAAVALGGYLRDIGFKKEGSLEILQGVDMKVPSKLFVSYESEIGSSVKVSGYTRLID